MLLITVNHLPYKSIYNPSPCNIFTSQCIKGKRSSVFTLLLRVDRLPVKFQRKPLELPVAAVGGHVLLVLAFSISLSLVAFAGCLCLIYYGLSLTACPQACLQCSRRDQCHLCDHGFFLKSGLCVSNCVPGFSAHSNETCAGKCSLSDALLYEPVISPCKGCVGRYSRSCDMKGTILFLRIQRIRDCL